MHTSDAVLSIIWNGTHKAIYDHRNSHLQGLSTTKANTVIHSNLNFSFLKTIVPHVPLPNSTRCLIMIRQTVNILCPFKGCYLFALCFFFPSTVNHPFCTANLCGYITDSTTEHSPAVLEYILLFHWLQIHWFVLRDMTKWMSLLFIYFFHVKENRKRLLASSISWLICLFSLNDNSLSLW